MLNDLNMYKQNMIQIFSMVQLMGITFKKEWAGEEWGGEDWED